MVAPMGPKGCWEVNAAWIGVGRKAPDEVPLRTRSYLTFESNYALIMKLAEARCGISIRVNCRRLLFLYGDLIFHF